MTPWFVLSYPRSRTAWLALFLSGAGVPCFHEAWKRVSTAPNLRRLMEATGAAVVCNSDSSNVFMIDALHREFPEARYVRITRPTDQIIDSLRTSYGIHEYHDLMELYAQAMTAVETLGLPIETLDWDTWDEDRSSRLVELMTGRRPQDWWVEQTAGIQIQLTEQQIARDIEAAFHGQWPHLRDAMRRALWV